MYRSRKLRVALVTVAALIIAAFILLAAFPWGVLKSRIEARATQQLGRPVTIGSMARADAFSLHPTVRLAQVRVPQPAWVGPRLPDLARIAEIELRFSALSLLRGGFSLEALDMKGARLQLYRDAKGRENWSDNEKKADDAGGSSALRLLTVADSRIAYRDDKQRRAIDAALMVDRSGLRLSGTGDVRGHAVRVQATGAPIDDRGQGARWPFAVSIAGDAVGLDLRGTMAGPLDIGHLEGQARAHATDLALLDAIIEAGLPGTQPVRLTAKVTRDRPDWRVENLKGTIGRSDIAGHATIAKRDGRTRIDGAVRANRFDFDDLSSNEGKRKAAARRARVGDRIVPATAIDLKKLARTDGRLTLSVRRLLWPGSSPFRTLSATLQLEKSRLELRPLTLGLTSGRLEGSLIVDQRQGGPRLTVDMALRSARLLDFFPETQIDGSLIGRIRLTGVGGTVRQAIGKADGAIELVARDGTIPTRTAALLGQDIGGGLTAREESRAVLRCMVARFDVAGGVARPAPVIIDTSRAQTHAQGRITLADERLALSVSGAPKGKALLRLEGSLPINGTIKAPDIRVPERVKSAKGIFGMIKNAITGHQGPRAADADCDALARRALR
ncbi:MAG: AsmA family protein [Sphingobium sp.]